MSAESPKRDRPQTSPRRSSSPPSSVRLSFIQGKCNHWQTPFVVIPIWMTCSICVILYNSQSAPRRLETAAGVHHSRQSADSKRYRVHLRQSQFRLSGLSHHFSPYLLRESPVSHMTNVSDGLQNRPVRRGSCREQRRWLMGQRTLR